MPGMADAKNHNNRDRQLVSVLAFLLQQIEFKSCSFYFA